MGMPVSAEPKTWLVEAAITVPGYWHPSEDERKEFFLAMTSVDSPGVEAEVGWTTDEVAFIRLGAVAESKEQAADAVLEQVRRGATEQALLAPAEVIRVAILSVRPLDELEPTA
jgi:hypothetical protein